ncbi:helix-turn-helix domain-containing protein [Sphaerisporangium corydalis]|uniref:Helix-turn-helix domain-containing protein n=1 Tax=Sphaerisporangium corydalis TaxID=1441875 RepID=A0ABV9EHW1_9ACTN|nr:helix-turn-helix transcriptional regulator [Sphaerisporangium corydalis]
MAGVNPTLRRRQLATRLRELRKDAGLSLDDVAARLECSTAKISRIETARRGVIPRDVRDLCEIYGAGRPEADALMAMAREARQPGWWKTYDEHEFHLYIGLEAEASSITSYDTCAVPGLLQTREYAKAIIRGVLPGIEEKVLVERADARMKRQEVLYQNTPPHHLVLLDESALHRHIGGPETMREQLLHLVEVARHPHITIRVIPFSVGAHIGFNSAFTLLEMVDPGVPDIVYTEALTRLEYYDRPADLAMYRETVGRLLAVSLEPPLSMERIEEVGRNTAL